MGGHFVEGYEQLLYRWLWCRLLLRIFAYDHLRRVLYGLHDCAYLPQMGHRLDHRMGLGTCGYDRHGILGGCNLGSSETCYTVAGDTCDKNTPLADTCPLDYGGSGDGCQPPNLITTLMNIALKPGNVDEPLYYGQAQVQVVLLLVAFCCVPWLLVVKPYIVYRKHQAEHGSSSRHHHYTSLSTESGHGSGAALPTVAEGTMSNSSASSGETKNLI